jgi:hypothetical protein
MATESRQEDHPHEPMGTGDFRGILPNVALISLCGKVTSQKYSKFAQAKRD